MDILLFLIGLTLSFFFAGAETAFISTNRIRFEIWLRNKIRSALMAEKYFRHPDIYLSTTLVGNNIANVMATSYATVLLINYFDKTLAWALITLTLLTFGEIVPKVVFRTHANNLILKVTYLIRFFHFLFNPIILIANKISSNILKFLRLNQETSRVMFQKQDIEVLMREAKISGVIDEDEHKIISKVLALPNRLVREAMVPRTAIKAIEYNASLTKLKLLISQSGYTKIPVYKKDIDNIVGVVFLYDLFLKPKSLREIIKPIAYIPENKKCNELLREFRQTNTTIAIVIDEYGGTAGLLTTEDLIEELFGDFQDSPLEAVQPLRALNKNTWQVLASESIDKIRDEINIDIPEGNYETLSGFILNLLGHIPKAGEHIELSDYKIVITRATRTRVKEVKIIKNNF